ncbi:hypothetical protein SEA_KARDASHIAN_65 [Streptomyces phage Kardashian]|nr:hypothetical protein SEA_KARDASHIAN_65 [Streptomyces phage Kardashian]
MAPKKPEFIGDVPVTGHGEFEGEVVGSAKIEKMPGGSLIAHIDASGMSADILRRGFTLGSIIVSEEPRVQVEKFED